MRNVLTQKEFVEKYNAGQREFTGVLMQFFDISDMKLSDLSIKDSEILFCTFRNCDLKGADIMNCRIYFLSFYTGTAKDIVFEKCDIELSLFDTFSFSSAKFSRCDIRWSGIMNSNHNTVDFSSSSLYKFFTDISQVTEQDLEHLIKLVGQNVERLDIGLRLKVKEMMRQDIDRYNLSPPGEEGGAYDKKHGDYRDSPLTHGEIKGLIEGAFGAYGEQSPVYKNKKSVYEKTGKYKN